MASNNFSISIPEFNGKNYHSWAIKMKAYLRAKSLLQDVIENDENPTLPINPIITQIKNYDEQMTKRTRVLTCLHSGVSEEIFTTIMDCESLIEA